MKAKIFTRNINLMLFISFLYMTCPMLISPIITGYTQSLGSSAAIAGIIVSLMNVVSLLLRPLSGNLTDRFSKYHLTQIGSLLLILAGVGYAIAWSPAIIILVRIIHGLGYAFCSVCVSTWMSNLLPRDKVGFGMGIYGMTNALAMALAPALSIYLYQQYSYHIVFIIMTILAGILFLTLPFVTDHGEPVAKSNEKIKQNVKKPWFQRLVQPRVVPVSIIIMLFSIPYFATQAYLVTYMHDLHTTVSAGAFFPLYAAVLLLMRISLSNYFDRIEFKYFLFIALFFSIIGLLAFSHLTSIWMMILAAIGLAGSYGLMYSICQSTALLLAPMNEQGLANSTFYIGLDLGMILGPIIGGFIFDLLPVEAFYFVMMLTIPLILLTFIITRKTIHVER